MLLTLQQNWISNMHLAVGFFPFLLIILIALAREFMSTFDDMVYLKATGVMAFLGGVLWCAAVIVTAVILIIGYVAIVIAS